MITASALALALLLAGGPPAGPDGTLAVRYRLDCRLEEPGTVLGRQAVLVRNESDWPLLELWFQLHPRAFRNRETALARDLAAAKDFELAWAGRDELGDIFIRELRVAGLAPVETLLHETELELRLRTPLRPGDSLLVEFEFETRLPRFFVPGIGRQGRFYFLNHWHPQLAAWRPGPTDRQEQQAEGPVSPSGGFPARAAPAVPSAGWHIEGVRPAGFAPAHRADYDVTFSLPPDLAVAATGQGGLVSRRAGASDYHFHAPGVTGFALVAAPGLARDSARAAGLTVEVFTRRPGLWPGLAAQAADIAGALAGWYGPPPLDRIAVVDATGIIPADAAAPGLILLGRPPVPLTRFAERALCRQLALQWFAPAAAPDPPGSSWLVVGPAVYSQVRWLDTRYGPTSLLDLPWPGPLAGFGDEWYNRLLYHLAASNRALGSLAEPKFDYSANPLSYSDSRYAQAGGFFLMLERRLGPEAFDRALRAWLERADRQAAPDSAFIAACSEAAGEDLGWLFRRWLPAEGSCDYALTGVKRSGDEYRVGIRRVGAIAMPVELEFRFADGTRLHRRWDSPSAEGAIEVIHPARLKSVELDPGYRLFESDRWNNHWPRKVSIHPLFALPSFEAYQFFYGPHAWYDDYHGLQLGAWLQGRQFIEAGPLRGRHAWTASLARTSRRGDWQPSVSYATPLPFLSDRLRFYGAARYSPRIATVEAILEQGLSPVLRRDGATAQLSWLLQDLADPVARDHRAWQPARTAELGFRLLHTGESRRVRQSGSVGLTWGSRALGGEHDYGRAAFEQYAALRLSRTRAVGLRLFAGGIAGSVPLQRRFYLSGGLVATPEEPATWAYEGPAAGQEHWHYTADVNCRGWAGEYRSGRFGWGANLHLTLLPFVQPFFDVGNVAEDLLDPELRRPRMDAGVRLKLSRLYADFPLWRWAPDTGGELIFKWMLGLNLAGFADF